jgi:hypothetical protein
MWAVLLLTACGEGAAERRPLLAGPEQADVAGGETSEFSGGDIPGGCPCGGLRNPLRATIMAVGAESVRMRVEDLLGSSSSAEVGSEIEGTWGGQLPCYVGRAEVSAGDDVLAFYWPSVSCVQSPGVECQLGATSPGRIALTPWGERMTLADASRGVIRISIDDLPLLSAPELQCEAELGNVSDILGPGDDIP